MNIRHKLAVMGAFALIAGSITLAAAQSTSTETLTIGFIGRSSGSASEQDQQLYQAAVLAAEQLNSDEDDDEIGILSEDDTRYELEVVYYEADTSADALDALNDAVEDDVIAVLGPDDETLAEPILDAGTPAVAVIFGAPNASTGSNIFRVAASYDSWAQAAADYLVNERKFENVGILVANTDEALNAAETFRQTVDTIDAETIVVDLTHSADEDDFSADAQSIRDADAEALFVWTLDAQMVSLLQALDVEGWEGEIIYAGLDSAFLERAGAEAGAELTDNLYGLTNWSPAAYDAQSQTFVSDYTARWEQTPVDTAAAYYDAVKLIGAAVEAVGGDSGDIGSELSNITDYDGVQGEYDNLSTDAVLVLQTTSSGLVEAARYQEAICANCPDTSLADISDEDVENSSAYTIGLIVNTDGANELTGDNIEQAARLAVREINEAGGVIGSDGVRYTLDLRVYPAATSDETSAAVEQAATDGVQILLGPDFNAQILTNLFAAENAQVPQLTSATNTQVTANEPANYVFQLRANDQALVTAAADYLLNVLQLENLATVAVRTDYGLDAINAFDDVVSDDDDAQVTLALEHDIEKADYAALAQQIADSDAQAVVVWSTQPAAAALLQALNGLNWEGVFVYGYLTPEFVQNSVAGSSVQVIGAVNWWASAEDWAGRDFTSRYVTRYAETPAPQSAAYYDAAYLIAQALQEVGAEPANIQSWLLEIESFRGVQGEYQPASYENGELTRMVYILGVQGETLVEVARYNDTECLIGCES